MKKYTILLMGLVMIWAIPAGAVEKKMKRIYSGAGMFQDRIALTLSLGPAIPLGDFSDNLLGNAQAGGVAGLEAEYYFTDNFAFGFEFSGGIFEDEANPDFTNWVHNYQMYGRFLVPVEGRVNPYGKFGMGLSTITYEQDNFGVAGGTLTSTSDPGFSLAFEGGIIWRASDLISLNAGLGYDVAFLEDAEVENSGFIVGYDPSYFSFNFGLGFFFKP